MVEFGLEVKLRFDAVVLGSLGVGRSWPYAVVAAPCHRPRAWLASSRQSRTRGAFTWAWNPLHVALSSLLLSHAIWLSPGHPPSWLAGAGPRGMPGTSMNALLLLLALVTA